MYKEEKVEQNGSWSDVLLKETGDIWTLKEFHENAYNYGYSRKKITSKPLGRASSGDKETNRRRVNHRRKQAVKDLINCNEGRLNIWHTVAYAKNIQNTTQAHQDRKNYYHRLERFVQSGKLFGCPVTSFVTNTGFKLKAIGVVDFQDGKRRKDKQGRGAIHFHQVINTPYLPQVQTIIASVYDSRAGDYKQAYLQDGGGWSLTANRHTLWFNTSKEANAYLKDNKPRLSDVLHREVQRKPLCVVSLLWEHGYTDIRSIHSMRKAGKAGDVGEYMVSGYMAENVEDSRLDGKKAYFLTGDLERPKLYRDPDMVEGILSELGMWAYQVDEYSLMADYIGFMSIYLFNFAGMSYKWILDNST